MQQKTRAIVLHYLRYGETSMIVTLYTEAFGRMSFMMQGIHGKKSRSKANLLQPLFLLDMEVSYKPGRELQRVKEMRNTLPYTTIPFEIGKSTQAMFLAEILYKVLREEEPRPELFEFLFHSVQYLDLATEGTANFHLVFLLQLARYLGFGPRDNYSGEKPYFDLRNGVFVTMPPPHPDYLMKEESRIFAKLIHVNFDSLATLKLDHKLRDRYLEALLNYFSLHLETTIHIKSLSILRELFL
ncbi:DNA repair protein RecO [Prolixibacter sp. SD074]|uniref:DNA repair protein RecO n=1 Tax=Prolixibacter sp. SD074 TaxID=2652391 RepID=UPI001282DB3B|nr:DNA repair protein RecO [Prolixibacter sp. SD074]GET30522.1 DNA repair protein RecO [Prolixibacter sp. SD074]